MACLTLAILMTPATRLAVWAEETLLSTSGTVSSDGR
jgi:hypothetical protein